MSNATSGHVVTQTIGDHRIIDASRAQIETHHIDIIPRTERSGKPRDQFTLWFAANANVVNFTIGGLAILFGLNLFWAIVAVAIGNILGTALTALHAWQGPKLGVPQMIQSRGQFGFYGASFILLASLLLDVGYMAAQQVLQADSMNLWIGSISVPWWIIIVTIPAVALAIFGYKWIHRIQRVLTVVFIVVIIVAFIQAATYHASVVPADRGFHLASFPIFLSVVGLTFMNMLSWAPYVSDYSRYLPEDVSFKRTFWAIFGGNVIATTLFMALGAWLAALAGLHALTNPLGALRVVSGTWILFFMALSQLPGDTLNAYTGMMAVASLGSHVEKFMEGRFRQVVRVVGLMLMFIVGTVLALTGYHSFLHKFQEFLTVLLFFFVPWSAINLIDFYFVRKGSYDVESFFTSKGVYGKIRWAGSIIYLITLGAQVPFLDTTLYKSPLVAHLHTWSISWIVGFIVSAVLYYIAAKAGWVMGKSSGNKKVAYAS